MIKIINTTQIKQISTYLNNLPNTILKLKNELEEYISYLEDGGLEINESSTIEDKIISCENVLDKMKEVVSRKNKINSNSKTILEEINRMKKQIESMIESTGKEESINEFHDSILEELLELEEERHKERKEELNN